ncbi:MAG: peptidoglycan-binding domain-containing protein [Candidatus Zapsychrus exili]|nr:peptidoglycan-binding domain-containing protein [Candidatus Zapsychrus exili]
MRNFPSRQKNNLNILVKISLCVVFVFLLCGCDVLYGILDKRGAEEKEIVGEVNLVDINYNVVEIQTLLKLYGYDPGTIDGVLGLKTRDMIARFQKENNLSQVDL